MAGGRHLEKRNITISRQTFDRFWWSILHMTWFHAGMCFLGLHLYWAPFLWSNTPKNPHFVDVNWHFQAIRAKYSNFCTIKKQFKTKIAYSDISTLCRSSQNMSHKSKMVDSRHLEKNEKLLYFSNHLTDFDNRYVLTCFCARMSLLGLQLYCAPFLVSCPENPHFGVWIPRHFQAKRAKYLNFLTIKTTAAVQTKIHTEINTTKYSVRVIPKCTRQNPTAASLKKKENHYMSATIWPILTICTSYDMFTQGCAICESWLYYTQFCWSNAP